MTPIPPSSSPEAAGLDELPFARQIPRPTQAIQQKSAWGWLAFTSVCIFWGTSGPLIRFTVGHIAPLWLVALRFLIAGMLLWIALGLLGRRPPLSGLVKVMPIGLVLACTNILVTFGFQRVQAGAGTLLLAMTAVSFAVVDVCWPGGSSKPSIAVWLGLLLGLIGVGVLVFEPGSFRSSAWQGYLMLALSTWTWAIGGVAQSRHPSGLDPLQSSSWQMLVAGSVVCPVAVRFESLGLWTIAPVGWLGFVLLVLTASLAGFVGFVYMLRSLPPYVAGAYTYVNAVVAALVSVVWLDERLTPRFYLSALLVLGGVALIQRRHHRQNG